MITARTPHTPRVPASRSPRPSKPLNTEHSEPHRAPWCLAIQLALRLLSLVCPARIAISAALSTLATTRSLPPPALTAYASAPVQPPHARAPLQPPGLHSRKGLQPTSQCPTFHFPLPYYLSSRPLLTSVRHFRSSLPHKIASASQLQIASPTQQTKVVTGPMLHPAFAVPSAYPPHTHGLPIKPPCTPTYYDGIPASAVAPRCTLSGSDRTVGCATRSSSSA